MPIADLDLKAARKQLVRVLASDGFARNERLTRFLRFVADKHLEGRDGEIKESVLAVEVFGRRPDHDPKRDSIVRTEASRLRARLTEYYAGEGKNDEWVIELPKGGYAPVFISAERAHPRTPAGPLPDSRPRTRLPLLASLAGLAMVVGALAWCTQQRNASIRVAVLPLLNLSQDPANDYFTDGLTGEIIRDLSTIEGLAVRSQTSSFALKGKSRNLRDAGSQLQADYILEGSVLRVGQRLRINAQFVRVRDDFALWSGKYDREFVDVLAIQDEISRGIVNSLRLNLGHGRRRYETSAAAYDSYLRARALVIQRGLPGWMDSVGPFEQVIENDPLFAPAYAALATAHVFRSTHFAYEPVEEMKAMRAAAQKALQLDPLLAEAHEALGMVYARDGQWNQSERSYRRAIKLDPNQPMFYNRFTMEVLLPLGRNEEGISQLRRAENADPLSPDVQYFLFVVLSVAQRFDEADGHCDRLPADFWAKAACQADAQMRHGKTDGAIRSLETEFRRGGWRGAEVRGYLGCAYLRAGRREEAEKLAISASTDAFNQARIFACMGDKDRTFEALDRASTRGPFRIARALTKPEMSFLRGDARAKILRRKVGLPE